MLQSGDLVRGSSTHKMKQAFKEVVFQDHMTNQKLFTGVDKFLRKCMSDRDTTRNIAFCFLFSNQDLQPLF